VGDVGSRLKGRWRAWLPLGRWPSASGGTRSVDGFEDGGMIRHEPNQDSRGRWFGPGPGLLVPPAGGSHV